MAFDERIGKLLSGLIEKADNNEVTALHVLFSTATIETLYKILNTANVVLKDEMVRRHLDE
jgi:hypothetical protein